MQMETKQIRKDGLTEEIEVRLPYADWNSRLETELQKLSERANLPGFRPGKAPRALLLRRFGEDLQRDLQNSLIQESIQQIFQEREVRPMRAARIESAQVSESDGLVYRAVFEHMPEIGAIDLSKLSFEAPELDEVPAEAINAEIDELKQRHRPVKRLEQQRAAAIGDMVLLQADGTINGEAQEGLSGPLRLVLGDGEYPQEFEEGVAGMNVGEERALTLKVPTRDENTSGEVAMRVKLEEVFEVGAAPETEELARALGLPDEHGLRGRVRANIAETAQAAAERVLRRVILDDLETRFNFALPGEALEDEYQTLLVAAEERLGISNTAAAPAPADNDNAGADTKTTETPPREMSEKDKTILRAAAERRLRLGVVLSEIARQNGLQVTASEIDAAMTAEARRYHGRENEALEQMRKDPHFAHDLRGPLLEDKVFRFIERTAKVKRRQVTLAELNSAVQEASAAPASTVKAGESDA